MANRQRTDVTGPLSRRSWGGMRDEPKVPGRGKSGDDHARHARDLSARFKIKKKRNKYGGTKIITYQVVFFLPVRDWIKTKVVLWASVVKQFSMRWKNTLSNSMPEIQG